MDGSIYLKGDVFENLMRGVEEDFTALFDGINILSESGDGIMSTWEGEAGDVWRFGLSEILSELNDVLLRLMELSSDIYKRALMLTDTQRKVDMLIKELSLGCI